MFHHSQQADMSTLATRAAQHALPRRVSMVAKLEAKAALPKRSTLPTLSLPTEPVAPVLTVLPSTTPTKTTWLDAASKIVVIGAGGAGCNAVGRMVDQPTANLAGIRFAVANTDAQSLKNIACDLKVALGPKVTRGLGAGGIAEVGTKAAEESVKAIEGLIGDADLVFLTLGLGGGTGSGAAPIIARIAREKGAVVVAIATMPFAFEGNKRAASATVALEHLRAHADTVVVVNNDALLSLFQKDPKKLTLPFAFSVADQCLQQAVDGMVGIIHHAGEINLDFADVRATLQNGGRGYFGTGTAEGDHAASKAMTKALNSHLLGKAGVAGAKKVLVYFKGDPAMGIGDVNEAMELLQDYIDPDAHTIFGWGPDAEMGEQVEVTLFAVGVDLTPTTPAMVRTLPLPQEKPERLETAIAVVPAKKQETLTPITPVYATKKTDSPVPTGVEVSTLATTRTPTKTQRIAESQSHLPLRTVRVAADDDLPAFLVRGKNRNDKAGTHPSFDLTTDQTDHSYHDELDVPAFLRRGKRGIA